MIIYSSIGNDTYLTGKLISNRLFKHNPIAKPVPEFKNFRYLENIWQECGELCNTSRDGLSGPYFNHVKANVQCKKIFGNEDFDRGHGEAHAKKKIPKESLQKFSMNGRVKIQKWYFDTKYIGGESNSPIWSKDDIERQIVLARKGILPGNYGISHTNALRDGLKHTPLIKNGRILVIGSKIPWVEASVLEAGAREVVTLEYGAIIRISKHAKIKSMVPSEFRQKYMNGTLGLFDGIVTFSSVEHSGLGRYGDAQNPWGDIITIARA